MSYVSDVGNHPVGGYSPGVRAGDYLFISGQIAIDPVSGAFSGGDTATQTTSAMKNLFNVLRVARRLPIDLVKMTAYLGYEADFREFDSAYTALLKNARPARSTIRCDLSFLTGLLVEIEGIAYCGAS